MGRVTDDNVVMGESDDEAQHLNAYSSGDDDDSEFDDATPLNEDGRLRMRSDISLEGPAYVGKKSSRSVVFESTDEKKLLMKEVAVITDDDDDDDDEEEDDNDDLHLLGNVDNDLDREYEQLRKQEEELVNKLKRKRTDDQAKGDSVRNQKLLWDRALEIRISMQKLVSGANQLPEMQAKLALCESDSQCETAFNSLLESAGAALNCFSELEELLIEHNSAITEAAAANGNADEVEKDRAIKAVAEADNGSFHSAWSRMDARYSRITPYINSSVDRWQRKTQLATGAAAVKGRFQAFNQSISQQLASASRNPTQLIASIRSSQSKDQAILGSIDNGAASDVTNEEAGTSNVEVFDDSEFYQQLLVEFLESSNRGGLGGIQRRQHTKKRKVVDRRASKGRKIRYNVLEPLVNFMAPEPMELPPMTSKLFSNLFGQRATPVS